MKKLTLLGLMAFLCFSLSDCKKKASEIKIECENSKLLFGKWQFVSRKITKYNTEQTYPTPPSITTSFDSQSYIEFKDNSYTWIESYQGKTFVNRQNSTECWANGSFQIYFDKSKGQTIPERILELTSNKLVFTYDVLGCGNCNEYVYSVTTELKR